jgi:ribonucleoside-triphosphate reductase
MNMTPYQTFIAKSRYSRYLPEENRREHWSETAKRWVGFFKQELEHRIDPNDSVWPLLESSINNLEALPSMRSIMTAGEALRRTNVAAYNCAYLPVDHQRAFDEAMYILLCGTGVGFSVEKQYVNKLPNVPHNLCQPYGLLIEVEDSKEGWCYAYQDLINHLYNGNIPAWDVSQVRPKGAPLKTFGGRASGPEPLVELFKFTIEKFKNAQGRKLTPLEAHDIMCKIGEVVVVGGVRRSAMISLGDLSDQGHATAKAGAWWEKEGQRALANNSAVYHEKPHIGEFMKEWLNIYQSFSGERGIINRAALKSQASRWGRRSADVEYGTNP